MPGVSSEAASMALTSSMTVITEADVFFDDEL